MLRQFSIVWSHALALKKRYLKICGFRTGASTLRQTHRSLSYFLRQVIAELESGRMTTCRPKTAMQPRLFFIVVRVCQFQ